MKNITQPLVYSIVLCSGLVMHNSTLYCMKKTIARNLFGAPQIALSPLASAVINGDTDTVKNLLDAGANPLSMANLGRTVLMCAAESGFEEIVMILIDAMNKRAKEVSEELRCPPQQSFGDIVRDYEGNHLDIQNELNGRTALMYAALNDHAAIVKILVEAGADMEITDNNGLPARQLVENSQGHNKDAILSLLPSDIGHAAKKRKIRHTTC